MIKSSSQDFEKKAPAAVQAAMTGQLVYRGNFPSLHGKYTAWDSALLKKTQLAALLSILVFHSRVKGYCFASNEYLSKRLARQPRTIRDLLLELENLGYIQRDIRNRHGKLDRRIFVRREVLLENGFSEKMLEDKLEYRWMVPEDYLRGRTLMEARKKETREWKSSRVRRRLKTGAYHKRVARNKRLGAAGKVMEIRADSTVEDSLFSGPQDHVAKNCQEIGEPCTGITPNPENLTISRADIAAGAALCSDQQPEQPFREEPSVSDAQPPDCAPHAPEDQHRAEDETSSPVSGDAPKCRLDDQAGRESKAKPELRVLRDPVTGHTSYGTEQVTVTRVPTLTQTDPLAAHKLQVSAFNLMAKPESQRLGDQLFPIPEPVPGLTEEQSERFVPATQQLGAFVVLNFSCDSSARRFLNKTQDQLDQVYGLPVATKDTSGRVLHRQDLAQYMVGLVENTVFGATQPIVGSKDEPLEVRKTAYDNCRASAGCVKTLERLFGPGIWARNNTDQFWVEAHKVICRQSRPAYLVDLWEDYTQYDMLGDDHLWVERHQILKSFRRWSDANHPHAVRGKGSRHVLKQAAKVWYGCDEGIKLSVSQTKRSDTVDGWNEWMDLPLHHMASDDERMKALRTLAQDLSVDVAGDAEQLVNPRWNYPAVVDALCGVLHTATVLTELIALPTNRRFLFDTPAGSELLRRMFGLTVEHARLCYRGLVEEPLRKQVDESMLPVSAVKRYVYQELAKMGKTPDGRLKDE